MKRTCFFLGILCLMMGIVWGCSNNPEDSEPTAQSAQGEPAPEAAFEKVYQPLPEGIQWLTNDSDPLYSSPKAIKGGTFHSAILSFPTTFRTVGPDSNSSFASRIHSNQMSLISMHPNTNNILPELATHWAFDPDKKTMYFKLDKDARWSDGVPVTAWDYVYTLEFMRSDKIIAPWYNDYYTRVIDAVIVYDDYTIAVKSTKALPDLHIRIGISPTPQHFYGVLDDTFVQQYNWKIVPNTGAYQISDFDKGKSVRFKRKKDWWAKDKRYFKNRFNVDYVVFDVIRDFNLQWKHFRRGELDTFSLTFPKYWHQKSNTDEFKKGYIKKIWFFNDLEQSAQGMWLNEAKPVFKDKRVRHAFAYAMNIERVIKKVLRGDYFRLPHNTFGYGPYTDHSIQPRTYDIQRVEQLMADAGWIRGNDGIWVKEDLRFSVKVTYSFEEHMPRLVVLKEEAAKAGVELILERLDSSAAYKKIIEKKHDVAWMAWSTKMRPAYWETWHSVNANKPQTNNITNTANPQLDALIDQYRASLDEAVRIDLAKQIQRMIHDHGSFVPTFMVPYVRLGYWRWLQLPEFYGTRRSADLFEPFSPLTGGLFWIDPDVKKQTRSAMQSGQTFVPETVVHDTYKVE